MNDINKSLETVKEINSKISKSNDMIIKTTEDLRIILFNLQILNAHLPPNSGIEPVIVRLEDVIEDIHDSVDELVKKDRKNLRQAMNEIEKYIERS